MCLALCQVIVDAAIFVGAAVVVDIALLRLLIYLQILQG